MQQDKDQSRAEQDNDGCCFLLDLPTELSMRVLSFCSSLRDIVALSLTCKAFYELTAEPRYSLPSPKFSLSLTYQPFGLLQKLVEVLLCSEVEEDQPYPNPTYKVRI